MISAGMARASGILSSFLGKRRGQNCFIRCDFDHNGRGRHGIKGRTMDTSSKKAQLSARFDLRAFAFLLVAALFATLAGCTDAQEKSTTIKLATATLNDTQHEWLKRFAAAIEKNTNGRIKAEIYPASQLGSIARMIEGTQLGSIQLWVGPPEFLVGV